MKIFFLPLFVFSCLVGCSLKKDRESASTVDLIAKSSVRAKNLSCQVFLRGQNVELLQKPQIPLIVQAAGTGLYTLQNGFGASHWSENLLSNGQALQVVYEKPGLSHDPDSRLPGEELFHVSIDFEIFRQHTMEHLVDCFANSLKWAATQISPEQEIVLNGHSEGASVALLAYRQLLEEEPQLARRIRVILVSGLPFEGEPENIQRQISLFTPKGLSEMYLKDFMRAIEMGDDRFLLYNGNLPAAHYRAAMDSVPLDERYLEIFDFKPTAKIHFLHGANDVNTPLEPLLAFENNLKAKNFGAFEIHVFEDTQHSLGQKGGEKILEILSEEVLH